MIDYVVRTLRESGLGRLPFYGTRLARHDDRHGDELLIESAPSAVEQLKTEVDRLEYEIRSEGVHVVMVATRRFTAVEGLAFLAENYDSYRDRPDLAEVYR